MSNPRTREEVFEIIENEVHELGWGAYDSDGRESCFLSPHSKDKFHNPVLINADIRYLL